MAQGGQRGLSAPGDVAKRRSCRSTAVGPADRVPTRRTRFVARKPRISLASVVFVVADRQRQPPVPTRGHQAVTCAVPLIRVREAAPVPDVCAVAGSAVPPPNLTVIRPHSWQRYSLWPGVTMLSAAHHVQSSVTVWLMRSSTVAASNQLTLFCTAGPLRRAESLAFPHLRNSGEGGKAPSQDGTPAVQA
jgi:hypothetical protein